MRDEDPIRLQAFHRWSEGPEASGTDEDLAVLLWDVARVTCGRKNVEFFGVPTPCADRSRASTCPRRLEARWDPEGPLVHWRCPGCGWSGRLCDFADLEADLATVRALQGEAAPQVRLPRAGFDVLYCLCVDTDARRMLASGQLDGDSVVVSLFRDGVIGIAVEVGQECVEVSRTGRLDEVVAALPVAQPILETAARQLDWTGFVSRSVRWQQARRYDEADASNESHRHTWLPARRGMSLVTED
jgi:hypothetical protein